MPGGFPGMPGGFPGMPGGFPGMPGMGLPDAGGDSGAPKMRVLSRTEKNARKGQRKRERTARRKYRKN
jgi:signal recognition particle subunit SRP54